MIDPKVAENARLAWENFMRQVCRMESRMLTAMAEKIDEQWADVAVPPVPRHDAATCCGERQVTECRSADAAADETSQADVGEGWRDLGPDEILQDGDEVNNGLWGWGLSLRVGMKAGTELRYRRRVTPVPPAPQLSPTAVSAMCQRNERDALLKKIATLRSEGDQQQEIILHTGLEIERLKAEVERMRLRPEEVQFLRATAGELEEIEWDMTVVRTMLKRQGGGE